MKSTRQSGEAVKISGFGTWSVKEKKSRNCRNLSLAKTKIQLFSAIEGDVDSENNLTVSTKDSKK